MDTKDIAAEIIRRLIEYNEPVTNWKVLLQQMRSDGFDIDKPGMNLLLSKLEKDGWIARPNADAITLERKEDYLGWLSRRADLLPSHPQISPLPITETPNIMTKVIRVFTKRMIEIIIGVIIVVIGTWVCLKAHLIK